MHIAAGIARNIDPLYFHKNIHYEHLIFLYVFPDFAMSNTNAMIYKVCKIFNPPTDSVMSVYRLWS
jgi:hypothetical protein